MFRRISIFKWVKAIDVFVFKWLQNKLCGVPGYHYYVIWMDGSTQLESRFCCQMFFCKWHKTSGESFESFQAPHAPAFQKSTHYDDPLPNLQIIQPMQGDFQHLCRSSFEIWIQILQVKVSDLMQPFLHSPRQKKCERCGQQRLEGNIETWLYDTGAHRNSSGLCLGSKCLKLCHIWPPGYRHKGLNPFTAILHHSSRI